MSKPDATGLRLESMAVGSWHSIRDARRESGGTVSDRVTWEVCPGCGRTAAVGWIEERPVEFDCTAGCHVTAGQLRDLARRIRVHNLLAHINPPGAPERRLVHSFGVVLPHTP